jgi:hypothetical protein
LISRYLSADATFQIDFVYFLRRDGWRNGWGKSMKLTVVILSEGTHSFVGGYCVREAKLNVPGAMRDPGRTKLTSFLDRSGSV